MYMDYINRLYDAYIAANRKAAYASAYKDYRKARQYYHAADCITKRLYDLGYEIDCIEGLIER